jgi:hypothetical protein
VEQEEVAVARQWYGKHVATATNKHATIERECSVFYTLLAKSV